VCEGLFISNLCVFQRLKTHELLEDLISDVMISFSSLCACVLILVALLVLVVYPCMTYLFEMDFLLQLRHAVTNLKHCLKLI
jgi:hypothetical protein